MRAGRLKCIITFDRPISQMGAWNSENLVFESAFGGHHAAIEPLRGDELLRTMQINAELTTKIITRWSPILEQVTAKWRIRWRNPVTNQDVIYNIGAPPIRPQMGEREIHFMCKSGINAG